MAGNFRGLIAPLSDEAWPHEYEIIQGGPSSQRLLTFGY